MSDPKKFHMNTFAFSSTFVSIQEAFMIKSHAQNFSAVLISPSPPPPISSLFSLTISNIFVRPSCRPRYLHHFPPRLFTAYSPSSLVKSNFPHHITLLTTRAFSLGFSVFLQKTLFVNRFFIL